MPPRKINTELFINKIVALFTQGFQMTDMKVSEQITKAADQLKSKSKEEAQRNIREEGQRELELQKQLLNQNLSESEKEEIQTEILKQQIKQDVWKKSQEIRRATYYSKPSHPYGHIFSESAISSISKTRKSSMKESDGSDTLVRDNRRTKIYHPAKKELTLQDAKVLIGIHKIWEENGKHREFEFTIYQLAKALNRDTGGKTYNEIWESLEILQDSKFEFVYYFEQGKIESLDRTSILQSIGRRDRTSTFRVMFSEKVYQTLQSGAIAYLSLAILEDLKTNTAQNLYLFLPSQIAQNITRWPIEEIIRLMGPKTPRPGHQQQMVKDACQNMVDIALLESFDLHTDETGATYLEVKPSKLLLMSSLAANNVEQLSLPI
jgi:hypothetical protein